MQITQCKSKILKGYENYISNKIAAIQVIISDIKIFECFFFQKNFSTEWKVLSDKCCKIQTLSFLPDDKRYFEMEWYEETGRFFTKHDMAENREANHGFLFNFQVK